MEDMERDDFSTEKKELPQLQKLKEEYGAVANDLSFVFLWMQRELLASQTLTDLAKCGKPREKQNVQSSTEEDEEEDSYVSNDEESTWTKYIPPSQTTITTLENTNKTEKTVLSNPSGAKVLGEEMLDIARALEDLNCGNPKKRGTENETPNNPSLSNLSSVDSSVGPKPKKRRRRRHEIVRNFKCNINGCTKSYGSEGALKTHVRLKHTGGGSDISQERKREDTGMNPYYSMNYPGAAGMPIILPPPSVPHAGDDPMIPQFKSFTPETRTDERLPPFSQVAHFGHAPEPMQSDHFNFVIRPNVMRT